MGLPKAAKPARSRWLPRRLRYSQIPGWPSRSPRPLDNLVQDTSDRCEVFLRDTAEQDLFICPRVLDDRTNARVAGGGKPHPVAVVGNEETERDHALEHVLARVEMEKQFGLEFLERPV